MRVCAEPSCPVLTDTTRCVAHTRDRDKARGSRQARGYGYQHRKLRAHYQQRMDQGERFTCWRCAAAIDPRSWDLGHADQDRNTYRGPECVTCNRGTATRR